MISNGSLSLRVSCRFAANYRRFSRFVIPHSQERRENIPCHQKKTKLHNGDFMGIPPTGKQATIPVFLIYRLVDDKIVEHWMQADSLGLLQQLGAIPAPISAH
jgi:SnoaL-like polyketide cyclase